MLTVKNAMQKINDLFIIRSCLLVDVKLSENLSLPVSGVVYHDFIDGSLARSFLDRYGDVVRSAVMLEDSVSVAPAMTNILRSVEEYELVAVLDE